MVNNGSVYVNNNYMKTIQTEICMCEFYATFLERNFNLNSYRHLI